MDKGVRRGATAGAPLRPPGLESCGLLASDPSIYSDAGTGRVSFDGYNRVPCGVDVGGREELERERPAVGVAVGRDHVDFVGGEYGLHRASIVEHQADVVELDGAFADCLPNTETDISARGRQEGLLEFGSVAVPGFVGLEEWESRRRRGKDTGGAGYGLRSVIQVPQPHDRVRVESIPIVSGLRLDERRLRSRRRGGGG
jgi:hypothetical protein